MIDKVALLLSKMMVTWIFGHYHIVHEMHYMWFMWFSHKRYKSQVDISHKFFVNSEFKFVIGDEIGHFICEDYNISTKMICLNHGNGGL